jgi:polyphosphate kinase 2 (PPK2 family)
MHSLKQWKLNPVDLASFEKWDEYTQAKEDMFARTNTADCPWTVTRSDRKKRAPQRDALPAAQTALCQSESERHRPRRFADRRAGVLRYAE